MIKFGFVDIVSDHLKTLSEYRKGKTSNIDIFLFYIIPFSVYPFLFLFDFSAKQEIYNVSITFFGIFIALLLNIQVAIFSIHLRRWDLSSSEFLEIEKQRLERKMETRKEVLGHLNSNISYLILFCCFSLAIFIILYAVDAKSVWATSLCAYIYIHFLLNFLMITRRSYYLFKEEYKI